MIQVPQIEPILNLEVVDMVDLRDPIECPEDAVKYLGPLSLHRPYEQCFAIFVTNRLRPLAYMRCGSGSRRSALIDMQSVVASTLLLDAAAVILVHTHPGIAAKPHTPSTQDIKTTEKLQEVFSWFGLSLLDSFILEHCDDAESASLSLTSIVNWIKDHEGSESNETPVKEEPEPERLVANV